MPTRIDLFPVETVPHAIRRLKKTLQRECIDDRIRRRMWGWEHYQKTGYVRRQEKFFAKVKAEEPRADAGGWAD